MKEMVRAEFQVPELRDKLLATNNDPLEETNKWHDNYWGACQCARCNGKLGLNWLGRILMSIRKELKGSSSVMGRRCLSRGRGTRRRGSRRQDPYG